ncbi:MAG TPA: hypothetical protein VLL52_02360 [Anaerolineae bacterium]|nr:hypothetical protein [Anaerolineae bacterium]
MITTFEMLNQLYGDIDLSKSYYGAEAWVVVTAVVEAYWQTALDYLRRDLPPKLTSLPDIYDKAIADMVVTPVITANMLQAVIQQGMPALFAARYHFPEGEPYVLLQPEKTTATLLLPVSMAAALRQGNWGVLAGVMKSLSIIRDVKNGRWPQERTEIKQRADAVAVHFLQTWPQDTIEANWPEHYKISKGHYPLGLDSLPKGLWYKNEKEADEIDLFNLLN